MYVRARVKELEAELAKKAVAPAPDRLMRRLLMKAEAEAAELQRKLDVKTTDLLNSHFPGQAGIDGARLSAAGGNDSLVGGAGE